MSLSLWAGSLCRCKRCLRWAEYSALVWASEANNLSLEGSARQPAPERLGPAAGSSLYQYVLYFLYSGYSQTFLDAVFDADHDARISSGQGRRQLAAFQRQSAHFARVHPETGNPPAGCMLLADLN